jgi:Na+/H+-dicarboxylate symporter
MCKNKKSKYNFFNTLLREAYHELILFMIEFLKGFYVRHTLKKYTTTNTLVLLAIVLGVGFGLLFPELALQQKIIGSAFLAFLKMLVVPLVFASIYVAIIGIGSLEHLKSIGLKTLGLYILTTSLAVILAIVAMQIFSIGEYTDIHTLADTPTKELATFSLESMILSFIPSNIFASLSSGAMMPIILFAILFAIASLHLREEQKKVLATFFSAVSEAMLKLAHWVILWTPLGVFSLISYVVAKQGFDVILGLWSYMLLVIGVLLLHAIVILPALFAFITKQNPYAYLLRIREAWIMAFSTASSAATLPISMRVSEELGGVDKKVASFVLPLGATVSMDGTAIYLSIAVLYIANLAGIPLDFWQQIFLGISVVALSVGVAALPSASLVMMVVILKQLGLPLEYIALIIAVDRILDMFRTSINVTSDLIVAKIVDTYHRKK